MNIPSFTSSTSASSSSLTNKEDTSTEKSSDPPHQQDVEEERNFNAIVRLDDFMKCAIPLDRCQGSLASNRTTVEEPTEMKIKVESDDSLPPPPPPTPSRQPLSQEFQISDEALQAIKDEFLDGMGQLKPNIFFFKEEPN